MFYPGNEAVTLTTAPFGPTEAICVSKHKFAPFLVEICMKVHSISNFKILSWFFLFLDPNIVTKNAVRFGLG
jgi:hypothetical protein